MAQKVWALPILLSSVGQSMGLWPQKLDLFGSETNLNCLVMGETSGVAYLGVDVTMATGFCS